MKKRGFTLVELLAAILVLAIILIIAVPKLTEIVSSSKYRIIEDSTKLIAKNAERLKFENETYGDTSQISCTDIANYDSSQYGNCNISFTNDVAQVILSGKAGGKFAGITCHGNKDNVTCSEGLFHESTTEPLGSEYGYVYSQIPITNPADGVNELGIANFSREVFLRYPDNVVRYSNSTEDRAVCVKIGKFSGQFTSTSFVCFEWNNYQRESDRISLAFSNCRTEGSTKTCQGIFSNETYTCVLKENGYVRCYSSIYDCTINESGVESCSEVYTTDPIYPIDPNLPTE